MKIKLLTSTFALILLLFTPVTKVFASSILFQDDFNDGNSNGWDVIGDSGWSVQNNEYGILLNPGLSNTVPDDSLWNYNWTNISFDVDLRGAQGVDKNVLVKFKDTSNFIELHANDKGIFLDKGASGGGVLASTNTILSNNVVYRFRFEIKDTGNIKVYKDSVLLFDVNERSPLITDWKIGLRAGTGGNRIAEVWFDNVIVKTLDATPSPSPIPTRAVLVPGMGASWNADALLNCKSDGYRGEWTMSSFAADIYEPLISALNRAGVNVSVFNYDWRKEIPANQPGLRSFIDSLGVKVPLVGHSMGGLLGRAYLETSRNDNKLTDLITVGSPHRGTALAYPVWSAGKVWDKNLSTKIAATLLLKRCGATNKTDREVLRSNWPAVQNLLPIDDYLKDKFGNFKPINEMIATNNWQPTDFYNYGVTIGTVSGTGYDTLQNIPVKDPSKKDIALGNWADGEPVGKETTTLGDGVVLVSNSELPGGNGRTINQTHLGVIGSSDGINQILDLLGIIAATSQTAWQEPKTALIVIGNNARLVLTDPKGKIRTDSNGIISVINPVSGKYKYALAPKKSPSELIVMQVKDNGDVLYNEYKFNNLLPKFGAIDF